MIRVATCTDIEQQWGQQKVRLKSLAKEMYKPVPTSEMCHGTDKGNHPRLKITPEVAKEASFNVLLRGE